MTDNRETIEMLKMLKEQALKSHNDTAVLEVKIDSFNFVLDEAIKALEQQPCEDAISRQAVLDIIMPYCQDDDGSVENTGDLRNALDDIESLPPVIPKQQPCDDCISRKDMLAVLSQSHSLTQAWDGFEKLPPVTPKEKTGKWIEIKNSRGTTIALRCSCCGTSPKHGISSDFCPNCGCRMKEVIG